MLVAIPGSFVKKFRITQELLHQWACPKVHAASADGLHMAPPPIS